MAGIADVLEEHYVVGLDTAIFIYHLEALSPRAALVGSVFTALANGVFQGVTSILTLMELAVKPLQLGRPDVADEYEVLLSNYPNLTFVSLDRAVARQAAELRAIYRLRPADAFQVSACLRSGAGAFLTNDRDLRRISEVSVLLLDDFVG